MGIKIKKDGVWVPISQGGINNVGLSALVNHGTVSTSSGTEAAFTGIPSTAKKILVSIHRISHAGTAVSDQLIMEVGDNSGYYSTGYESCYDNRNDPNTVDAQFSSTFYGISNLNISDYNYSYNIELVHVTGNSWTISHMGGSNQSTGAISTGAGSITLSNTLDKLRIKTENGLAFDNGNITVYYQTEGTVGSSTSSTSSTSSGSSNNYESSILSLNGTNQVEFTDIPSWATKITLVGENVLLPQPNTDSVGSLLEFGGPSGYLGANSYAYNLHYGTLNTGNTFAAGMVDSSVFNHTPYADFIILYGSSSHQNYPILSQVFITFQKVKGENKWVYKGSASNRQGDPSTTVVDYKWLNNFTGSFTATEAITKLKFYSYEGAQHAAGNVNYTGGSVTAIYEGEGSGSSSSSSSSSTIKVATIVDQKSSSTAGGDSQTSWTDRDLNTKNDPDSIVSLSGSNYFSLSPGTYRIKWSAPAYKVNRHQTRLVYSTTSSFTSTTEVYGSSEYNATSYSQQTRSFGETILTLENTTYFKIQHKCQTQQTVNGFGFASQLADEIYTQVFVEDLTILGSSSSGSGGTLENSTTIAESPYFITSSTTGFVVPSNATKVKILMCGGGGGSSMITYSSAPQFYYGSSAGKYQYYGNITDLTTNGTLDITIGAVGVSGAYSSQTTAGGSTKVIGNVLTLTAPGGYTKHQWSPNTVYNSDTVSSELTSLSIDLYGKGKYQELAGYVNVPQWDGDASYDATYYSLTTGINLSQTAGIVVLYFS
jgi:hypothetical protein